jgi:aspartokinase
MPDYPPITSGHTFSGFDARALSPLIWTMDPSSLSDQAELRLVANRLTSATVLGCRIVAILPVIESFVEDFYSTRSDAATELTEPGRRELAAVLSVGGAMSGSLVSMAVTELGSPAVSLRAEWATSDDDRGAAMHAIRTAPIREALAASAIVLVAGLQHAHDFDSASGATRSTCEICVSQLTATLGATEYEPFRQIRPLPQPPTGTAEGRRLLPRRVR